MMREQSAGGTRAIPCEQSVSGMRAIPCEQSESGMISPPRAALLNRGIPRRYGHDAERRNFF